MGMFRNYLGKGGITKGIQFTTYLSICYVLGTILGAGFSKMPKIQRLLKSSHSQKTGNY